MPDAAQGLAERLVAIDPAAVPDDVVQGTKRYIVDCLAAGIAGRHADGSQALVDLVSTWGGAPEATIWGSSVKVPAVLAGMVNSQLARALDFDDISSATFAHLTCSVLPAALAMAEATGQRDGRTLVANVAIGRDLICRLGLAAGTPTFTGRSSMYQLNAFASAVVGARYLGLPAEGMVSALGLVYGQGLSSKQGLIEGAQVPRVHQGLATQLGLQCAFLAARGLVGARNVFEGRFGYFPLYEDGRFDRSALLDALGERFHGLDSSIKKHPVCMHSHTAIEATIEARRQLDEPPPEAIAAIAVRINSRAYHTVYDPIGERRRPSTAAQVQFSLPWVVALAAAHGRLPVSLLTPDPRRDEAVAALADRVTAEIASDFDAAPGGHTPATVEITLVDGRRAGVHVDVPPGSPGRELEWDAIEQKLRDCCAWEGSAPAHTVDELLTILRSLEDVGDIGAVVSAAAALAPPGRDGGGSRARR